MQAVGTSSHCAKGGGIAGFGQCRARELSGNGLVKLFGQHVQFQGPVNGVKGKLRQQALHGRIHANQVAIAD